MDAHGRIDYNIMKRTMDFVYYSKNKVDNLSKFARNLSLYLRYFLDLWIINGFV